jgi:5-methylcytosine-specific restriction enzyme subunit McrC
MYGADLPRTVVLTERVTVRARLAPVVADFLLDGLRHVVTVNPTRRRHYYRLTPLGHVGVLPAPGVRLVIRPKIPLRNVFYMVDPSAVVPEAADASMAEPAGPVLSFLAGQFARHMAARAAAGLHLGYAEVREVGPFLRGRLTLPDQLRERHPGRLHSDRDELTADIPCNQAIVATAERLLLSPLLHASVQAALRRALTAYEGIRSIATRGDLPAPEGYREVLELRQLLEEGLQPGERSGSVIGPAFLLDLGRVFERYVAAGVRDALGDGVRVQPPLDAGGREGLAIRPDLLIERQGRPPIVADTKWKRFPAAATDLYQVIAYATAVGAKQAVLVYPGSRARERAIAVGPVAVQVRTVNVSGQADSCRRSLGRLCRELDVGK